MTHAGFDWTEILPEPERSTVRAELKAKTGSFLEGFPTREELNEAARDGRASFERACAIVDKEKAAVSDTREDTIETAVAFQEGYKTCKDDMMPVFAEIERLRLATDEGSLAKRADRIWEIACQMLGKPVPGAKLFLG